MFRKKKIRIHFVNVWEKSKHVEITDKQFYLLYLALQQYIKIYVITVMFFNVGFQIEIEIK